MQDYHLKTNTEYDLWNCLEQAGLVVWHLESNQYRPINIALDVIGTIYKETGQMMRTNEGFLVAETKAIDGFHANIRGVLTEEQLSQLPLIQAPATPFRVWA